MKMLSLCSVLLLATALPAWATQPAAATTPPASAASSETTLRQELDQLQQRMGKLAKRMGTLSARLGETTAHSMVYQYLANPDRGRLGIVITADAAHHGFKVLALTPDGPAQQAGLHVGDIITAMDGKAVQPDQQRFNPFPLGKLKAGQSVQLHLLRNGKSMTLVVKARHLGTFAVGRAIGPALHINWQKALARALKATQSGTTTKTWTVTVPCTNCTSDSLAHVLRFSLGNLMSPWWGLNLAPLNADLGSYFGTRHGALVLTTQAHRYPGLQAGDVITDVDGHAVQTPGDVMRSLRGTSQGSTVHMTVLRHGHKRKIMMQVPAPAVDALQFPTSAASSATQAPASVSGKERD